MPEMNGTTLRNQIEERLMIQRLELIKLHRVAAMLNRKSRLSHRLTQIFTDESEAAEAAVAGASPANLQNEARTG